MEETEMTQIGSSIQCAVCGGPYVKSEKRLENGTWRIECKRCGRYEIGNPLRGLSEQNKPWHKVRHLVSAWIRKENKADKTPFIGAGANNSELSSPDWWESQYKHMGFPETTSDKLDALLVVLADSAKEDYEANISIIEERLIAEIAVNSLKDITGLIRILEEFGYVTPYLPNRYKILGKGWLRIDELRKVKTASDSAFVAMWFHDTTKKYREAVIAAIKHCDYKPVILDKEEYNGFIMEQAISQIKQARFVVADFTCRPEFVEGDKVKAGVRGGVYWEAGMAYGLNKPVIHTCEDNEDAKSRRHFDIDQYNTIFRKPGELNTNIRNLSEKVDNPTFAEKLANRILWVVGRGSFRE
jgi:nucleoside 2-deoxyribosyltransferase